MSSEGLPRTLRLRRRVEFLRVQRGGDKFHLANFLVFIRASKMESGTAIRSVQRRLRGARLGVTVTRKVGSAVIRNRIKRWVREAYRRNRDSFPVGFDMVWVAKREAADAGYEAVLSDMGRVAQKLSRRSVPGSGASRRLADG